MSESATKIARIREAYASADKARCAERLRHHVWTPRHPERRIHRLYRCVYCRAECQTQAHHVDYGKPFLVSWLCVSCHRRVEAESIKLQPRHLFDYSSLVRTLPQRWRRGSRGPRSQDVIGYRRRKVLEEAPF